MHNHYSVLHLGLLKHMTNNGQITNTKRSSENVQTQLKPENIYSRARLARPSYPPPPFLSDGKKMLYRKNKMEIILLCRFIPIPNLTQAPKWRPRAASLMAGGDDEIVSLLLLIHLLGLIN